jgi:PhoPQ-activated pathogenicity-related protein
MSSRSWLPVAATIAAWSTAILFGPPPLFAAPPAGATVELPIDDYLDDDDGAFSWEVVKGDGKPGTTVIKLTSQSWRAPDEVSRQKWEHWLIIARPEELKTDKCFLLISGGGNDGDNVPDGPGAVVSTIAAATGSIVVELKQIPNQPIVFHGDGTPRKEDDLIAYCWDKFLDTGDATWLPRLPMVKSVVKAMDCIQEWSTKEGIPVEKFIVAGGSKRGWTTWMTGATDHRVEAIMPIVIDVLNLDEQLTHHGATYGFWSKALGDYVRHGIVQNPEHERMQDLHAIEDPHSYLDRLTIPKFIINGSGDQFFVPDSSRFYYDDLAGEKHLYYVPNTDHGVEKNPSSVMSIIAFYQMIIDGRPRPNATWTFEDDGSIRVTSDEKPTNVVLWQAHNPDARDFRLATIGKAYQPTVLKQEKDGSWIGKPKAEPKGWTAAFVELEYATGGAFPYRQSTAVRITPDTLPHAGFDPKTLPYEGDLPAAGK